MTKESKGLRLIFQANAPWCATGYGVQGNRLLPAWKDMDEVDDVLVYAFYGLQGGRIKHRIGTHTFDVWPILGQAEFGGGTVSNYAAEFKADLVITLVDIWPLDEQYGTGFLWSPYMPLDVTPVPPVFLDRLRNAYLPIVYAKNASHVLEDLGIEHVYAPHGVDTKVYRPIPTHQKMYRRMLQWPEAAVNGFVFGMVAANKGYPPRKAFPEVMEAFAKVYAEHDDVWLYLHTIEDESMGGPNLKQMARMYGIGDRVMVSNKHLLMSGAYDDLDMMRVFNSFDCLLSPSYSEGFGLPQIEAQACGVPVIATDAFAMTELNGAGWLVPWDHKLYMPVGASYVMPSVSGIYDAMGEAIRDCKDPTTRELLRAKARAFAMDYDWGRVIAQYWRPIIKRLHRELTPRLYTIPSNWRAPVEEAPGVMEYADIRS